MQRISLHPDLADMVNNCVFLHFSSIQNNNPSVEATVPVLTARWAHRSIVPIQHHSTHCSYIASVVPLCWKTHWVAVKYSKNTDLNSNIPDLTAGLGNGKREGWHNKEDGKFSVRFLEKNCRRAIESSEWRPCRKLKFSFKIFWTLQFMTNGHILRLFILQSSEIVHLSFLFFYFDL